MQFCLLQKKNSKVARNSGNLVDAGKYFGISIIKTFSPGIISLCAFSIPRFEANLRCFFSRGAHPSKQEFLFLGRWRRNSFTPRAVSRNMSSQRGKSFQGRAPWWWSFCSPELKKNEKVGYSNSMFSQKFCFRLCRVPDVLGRFWRSFRTLPVAVVFWNLHINCS